MKHRGIRGGDRQFACREPRLFENLTSMDHMRVIGRLWGVADAMTRGAELLAQLGLAEQRDAFPAELSRGMKQKLMIAAALLHRPKALVLDEPLTGLDPGAMRRMMITIREQAAAGTAILISSHMLHLVQEMAHGVHGGGIDDAPELVAERVWHMVWSGLGGEARPLLDRFGSVTVG